MRKLLFLMLMSFVLTAQDTINKPNEVYFFEVCYGLSRNDQVSYFNIGLTYSWGQHKVY